MTPAPDSPIRVPATFPAQPARLMFVGEAPGQWEVEGKPPRPLIGPSGTVFNQLLRTANIDRAEVAVGNLFEYKAVDNDVGPWLKDTATAMAAVERLAREVKRSGAHVVVPMGAAAVWAFLGTAGVEQVRGSAVAATQCVPGVKVLPTFHPAYVMRMWKFFTTVAADFVKADTLAQEPRDKPISYSHREVWIEPTLADLEFFEQQYLAAASVITLDIETSPKARQITCVGVGGDGGRAIVVPFVDDRRPNRSYWATADAEVAAWEWLRRQCARPQPKLMQNGTYDTFWLWDRMGIAVRNYSMDTRLLHHALYPELPKSLAYMASCYLRQMPWKSWGRKQEEKRDA